MPEECPKCGSPHIHSDDVHQYWNGDKISHVVDVWKCENCNHSWEEE